MCTKCNPDQDHVSTVPVDIADGEAVVKIPVPESRYWYIAIVPRMKERALAQILEDRGVEYLLPAQERIELDRRGKEVTRLRFLFYGKVFVHISPSRRRVLCKEGVFHRFLIDISAKLSTFGTRPPATVPDYQMDRFRLMLQQTDSPVSFAEMDFRVGDKVRVQGGSLDGFEGHITQLPDGKSLLSIILDHLGCATIQVDTSLFTLVRL